MTRLHRRPWLPEQDDLLRQMDALDWKVALMAEVLGRTTGAVAQRRTVLGLNRGSATCVQCGTPLTQPARGRRRRYCGPVCARRSQRVARRPTECQLCGEVIPPERSRARFFCSEQCKQRAWYRRKKAADAAATPVAPAEP